ncbi:NR LBD domain-containing protein [Caenorhabditis elegans]|uniref:NR LBD domain-containing protein n=1 Tax=Caenorhabditis elegans TaxID=6239 RepID=O16663_CAEEL|nr:NR LBD domain-containing protein [Caenorhabditis elegans]CCD74243.2 NR LBD domain-containing protein [Caenorhabditis elegans]|eukprot:NP_503628.2 Nuclear Hormone Receptor family [Caenorhabditis elegans]
MTNSPFSCRICGMKAHGTHFGAVTCRACAAFFRRSSKSKWINKKCQSKTGNKARCFCRPCRLRRCLDNGMEDTKFQYGRDLNLPADDNPLVPSISNFVGRPEFLLFCDSKSSGSKIVIDVQPLIKEASRLLRNGCATPLRAESQLKKLTLGLKVMQCDLKNVKCFDKIGKAEFLDIIEFYFMAGVKWVSHFDHFQKLDQDLQMKLAQSIWNIFIKIHKCSNTAKYRKSNSIGTHDQKILRNMCVDREKVKFDFSWMSDYPQHFVKKYMFTHNTYDSEIVEALIKLDPTDVELTYMIAQLCFEYAGKRFQGEILKVTDHFQQTLSNDLHHYYTSELNRERYLKRLTDFMKINKLIQKSIWETRPHRELGKVFNVLKTEFSHPEMFEDTGFC